MPLRLGLEISFLIPRLAVVAEGAGNLLSQPVEQSVDQIADVVGHIAHVQVLATTVTRIEDLMQVRQDIDHFAVAGQGGMTEVVDRATFLVGRDDPPRDRRQRVLDLDVVRMLNDRAASDSFHPVSRALIAFRHQNGRRIPLRPDNVHI